MFMHWKFRFAIWAFNRWARPFRVGYNVYEGSRVIYRPEAEVDEVFI